MHSDLTTKEIWEKSQAEKKKLEQLKMEERRISASAETLDHYALVESTPSSQVGQNSESNLNNPYPSTNQWNDDEMDAAANDIELKQKKPEADLSPAELEAAEARRSQREFASACGAVPYGGYGN